MPHKVKPFLGHRVVGYFESPTSRYVIIAVRRQHDYVLIIGYTNAERDVDSDLPIVFECLCKTRAELDRDFWNVCHALT